MDKLNLYEQMMATKAADEKIFGKEVIESEKTNEKENSDVNIELINAINNLANEISSLNHSYYMGGFQSNNTYPNNSFMLEMRIDSLTNALEKVSEVLSK